MRMRVFVLATPMWYRHRRHEAMPRHRTDDEQRRFRDEAATADAADADVTMKRQ
jgi:hypothetical protein